LDPLSYLFSLEQFGIKFGLDNISTLVARLGHPERGFRSIHIAGTNGKGSVTAMVDAAIRAAGHRSARYTSPHLVDLSERFVIDGRPIAHDTLVAAVADVRDAVESLRADGSLTVQPTFFEVTTAVAFELFRRAGVDTAVLEVGLGGRLDSTNVVSPIATAITSIALDHEQYLGSTLAEIAFEKAGIIKPGVPLVVGDLASEAVVVVERIARERGAEMIRASAADAAPFRIGLLGRHQVANAAIAVRVLEVLNARGVAIPASAIASGLAEPGWPGRLDLRRLPDGRELLLDAAHNPAGAASLASYLRERRTTSLPLVFAAMRDKNITGVLAELAPVIGSLVVTRASNPRSADPSAIAEQARALAPSLAVSIESSPAHALAAAWRRSPAIVVAGSIFLLGDVMRQIGVS
jgi:dihydrofolate synthase/folylpolyglutamate synthase